MNLTRSDSEIKVKIEAIREAVQGASRILVTSHVRPDGDAIGSLIGMGLALKNAGKMVDMVLEDKLPENFMHLTGSEMISSQWGEYYDLIIVLDSSDLERVGDFFPIQFQVDINIDHHITNLNFGNINLVIDKAAATSEILAELIPELGLIIDRPIANALLSGILTDTIGFRTASVSPDTLRIAADLMKSGADLSTVYYKGLSERSYNGALYWGLGLSKLSRRDGLVWTTLTLEDRRKANYEGNDDADLINVLSAIEGAEIAIIFVEQKPGRVKISWRVCGLEQSRLDVSKVAQLFGGGGHKPAAGAIIEGKLEEVQKMVLEKTQSIL